MGLLHARLLLASKPRHVGLLHGLLLTRKPGHVSCLHARELSRLLLSWLTEARSMRHLLLRLDCLLAKRLLTEGLLTRAWLDHA